MILYKKFMVFCEIGEKMFKIGNTEFLTADDIAEELHVSREKAYKILHSPKAITVEIGRKLMITANNFEKLFNDKIKI